MAGRFVSFEGIDGCGKSTVARLVAESLHRAGVPVRLTAEPQHVGLGVLVRARLRGEVESDDDERALLFLADRYQHLRTVVRPALSRGEHVLCDRYLHSTVVYQRDVLSDAVLAYHATRIPRPDLVVLLDVPTEVAAARMALRGGRPERYEDRATQGARRAAYLDLARADRTIRVVDARPELPEVVEACVALVEACIGAEVDSVAADGT